MKIPRRYVDYLWAFLFIAPTVLGLYLFFLYPMISSVYISLTKWDQLSAPVFVGLANYARLFSDEGVFAEFMNTLFFVVTMVPLIIIISLLLANMLNGTSRFTGFYRTVLFLPYVLLPVVSAQIWLIMFNSRYGLINVLLKSVGMPQPSWLGSAGLVRLVIIFVGIWTSVGYYAVIILSGLQNIPKQYYEACELDGCTPWKQFIHITVPLVTPQLFFAAIIAVISIFKMFDYIFVFGKSNVFVRETLRTLAFGIYERGFTYMEMGYASAEAVLLCAIVLGATIVQNIGQKKWVYYG